MNDDTSLDGPIVLAITGASGAVYALRLLQTLVQSRVPLHVVVSPSGFEVIKQELPSLAAELSHVEPMEALLNWTWPVSKRWVPLEQEDCAFAKDHVKLFEHHSYMAPMASGSFLTRGMVVCPCSGSTLSGIVHAASNNLVVRAADVHLKERRKLILVNRETPLSVFQLENMNRAAQAGAVVLPAMPGWYHGVTDLLDLVDFIVARILDQLGIPHSLMRRWGENEISRTSGTIKTSNSTNSNPNPIGMKTKSAASEGKESGRSDE